MPDCACQPGKGPEGGEMLQPAQREEDSMLTPLWAGSCPLPELRDQRKSLQPSQDTTGSTTNPLTATSWPPVCRGIKSRRLTQWSWAAVQKTLPHWRAATPFLWSISSQTDPSCLSCTDPSGLLAGLLGVNSSHREAVEVLTAGTITPAAPSSVLGHIYP